MGLQRAECIQPNCCLYNTGIINPGNTTKQVFKLMLSGSNPIEYETRARLRQILPALGKIKLVNEINKFGQEPIYSNSLCCIFKRTWHLRSAEAVLVNGVLVRTNIAFHESFLGYFIAASYHIAGHHGTRKYDIATSQQDNPNRFRLILPVSSTVSKLCVSQVMRFSEDCSPCSLGQQVMSAGCC